MILDSSMPRKDTEYLKGLLKKRRTHKPSHFKPTPPDTSIITDLIDAARNAPNHHRTQPARFYLLDKKRIRKVGKLFGQVIAGDGNDSFLVEKGKKKASDWGMSPGLLVVTCFTDLHSDLLCKKPEVAGEDYATCACICQNLLLLMEAEGISTKWSTGPVWKHERFAETIGLRSPQSERVVALLFYGFCETILPPRVLSPLSEQLVSYNK